MKKTNILTLFCAITALLLCLTACNPVIKENISVEELKPIDKESISFVRESNSTYAVFPNIENAKEYGYSLNNINERSAKQGFSSLNFRNGHYWGEINANGIVNGSFTLYASNGINDVEVEVPFSIPIDINEIAPKAYVSLRKENSVEISLTSEPFKDLTEYKVVNNDSNKEYKFESTPMTVDGLDADKEYSLTIYHKLKSEDKYGKTTQTIKVPKFDAKQNLTLSINDDNSAFVIMNQNEVQNSKYILKLDGKTIVDNILDRTVRFKELGSLTCGNFQVEQINNVGDIIASSNTISHITPLYMENPIVTQQTYTFTLDLNNTLLQSINETNFKNYFSISINASSSELEFVSKTADKITLRISKLESKNDYNATLLAKVGNSETSINLNFKTKSFAGTYKWEGKLANLSLSGKISSTKNGSFQVKVVDADSTAYKYYIYSNESDGEEYRIMPLLDESKGEKINNNEWINFNPDNISSSEQWKKNATRAYAWNYNKWKGTLANLASVTEWRINSCINEKDSVKVETASNTSIVKDARTSTAFEFALDNGPVLLFTNESNSSMVNNGILKCYDETNNTYTSTFKLRKIN